MVPGAPQPPRGPGQEPQSPSEFGKYELLSRLASGGMAQTFLARLRGPGGVTKQVVIKRVLPSLAEDEAFITAFINEAKLSAALSHGNIAQVFDFGRVDGDYFLAMEWVDGRSLAEVLERAVSKGFAKLPESIGCFIAIEVLKALHYAHTRVGEGGQPLCLVHRDVSPENVLISFEGQTKVVDFGVAKAVMSGRPETEPGMVKGKFLYFSPEQACAEPLDGRSDVFAVGVLLYRMACGVLPFEGQMHVVMRKIVAGQYPPPLVLNPRLSMAVADVIARAMAVDRSLRFSTALQMQDALSAHLYAQEPTFSSETLKDWMTWLFRPELEAERRSVALNPRFEVQLKKWNPASQETAPAVPAVTRDAPATSARSPRLVAVWVAVALGLIAAGIFLNQISEPAEDSAEAAAAVQRGEERARLAQNAVKQKALNPDPPPAPVAPVVEKVEPPPTLEQATRLVNQRQIVAVGRQAVLESADQKQREADAAREKLSTENQAKIDLARSAIDHGDFRKAWELLAGCKVRGRLCAQSVALGSYIRSEEAKRAGPQPIIQKGDPISHGLAAARSAGQRSQPETNRGPTAGGKEADLLADARQLIHEHEYSLAKAELEKCVELDPLNPDPHKLLGEVWARQGKAEKAADEYREFLRLAPRSHPDVKSVQAILDRSETPR